MINITNIETTGDKICVTVTLKRHLSTPEFTTIVICKTSDVIKLLTEKKIKIGKCIQDTRLCNNRDHTCTGTWVFEKPVRKSVAQKKIVTSPKEKPRTHKAAAINKKIVENVNKDLTITE